MPEARQATPEVRQAMTEVRVAQAEAYPRRTRRWWRDSKTELECLQPQELREDTSNPPLW